MSGTTSTNPFRRKGLGGENPLNPTTQAPNSILPSRVEVQIPPINTDIPEVPRQTKAKTSKTVRIISPHSATSDEESGIVQRFSPPQRTALFSPSPEIPSPNEAVDESPKDPFSAGSDVGSVGTDDEAIGRSSRFKSPYIGGENGPPSGMPVNPFKKTLASLGTESKLSSNAANIEQPPHEQATSSVRPQYDVDDFKRLLLTGEKSSPRAGAPSSLSVDAPSHHTVGDNSSNTDASSISRQSIFEPVAGTSQSTLQESPRTSQEGSPSDNEPQQLIGGQSITSPKIKPPTPQHRHGKLVKANTPQTVSFEDPVLAFPSANLSSASSEPPPQSVDISGNVHKPLPSIPQIAGGKQVDRNRDVVSESRSGYPTIGTGPVPEKRTPPMPPISRRHSQLKSEDVSRSKRASFTTEGDATDSSALSRSPSNSSTKVPPPPPPRRFGGPVRVNSSSSISSNYSMAPLQSQTNIEQLSSSIPKTRPPAPPNHSPTISSVKRQQTQPSSTSPIMAPPPPPRRRGSSQSSYNPSRLSGDYRTAVSERLRSDSGASSVSHLQLTPMTSTPNSTGSKDVMADLSMLQREVDELRGKFRE